MIVYRYTNIFQVTTKPVSLALAQPRTGGWTESFWAASDPTAFNLRWNNIIYARCALLPTQAALVGWRTQKYDVVGNKLIPLGATNGRWLWPGQPAYVTDLPQVALSLNFTAQFAANTTSYKLLCLPDEMAVGGEYNPTPAFTTNLNYYLSRHTLAATGFIGRDLSQAAVRVMSIVPAVIFGEHTLSTDGPMPGVVANDFVRFLRVYDDMKQPVKGSFLVKSNIAGVITIKGSLPNAVTNPSGLVRKDLAIFMVAKLGVVGETTIRKVGRPTKRYVGRASNRR